MTSPFDKRSVHPIGRSRCSTPGSPLRYDVVVIGGDIAAVSAASEARRRGRRVALAVCDGSGDFSERQSWALDQAFRQAAWAVYRSRCPRHLRGVPPGIDQLDFPGMGSWVNQVRTRLAPEISLPQLADSGVDVYRGKAVFVRPNVVEVDQRSLSFRKAILATGSQAVPPAIEGHDQTDCLRPEDVLGMAEAPRRLAVIGTGPRSCLWAQILRRLGSEVHLIGRADTILPAEDPLAALTVQEQLARESVRLHLGCHHVAMERTGSQTAVVIEKPVGSEKLFTDRALVDWPRRPDVDGLRLDAAGVALGEEGVKVNRRLQTTNPRIFAAGETDSRWLSSPEAAAATGRLCVHNALAWRLRRPRRAIRVDCIWTDPEIIQVGLTAGEASSQGIRIDTYRAELAQTDSAVPECGADGYAVVHVRRATGRILGACVVAEAAGELVVPLMMLINRKLTLTALADVILCRPTQFQLLKVLADQYAAGPKPSMRMLAAETWRRWGARGLPT